MGGGGGGPFRNTEPETLKKQVREAEEKTTDAAFEVAVNESLLQLLAEFNDRDIQLVNIRLGAIKELINDEIDDAIDSLYGGSVAKHTYVDGLSDIDSLLIVNGTKYEKYQPKEILDAFAKIINARLGNDAVINVGRIAITVSYKDGMKIQLLPAIRTSEGLKVPAWKREGWSNIDPDKFRAGLSKRNAECHEKIVPLIKLVKAINSNFPEDVQLSGYHIESLAIAAFRGYDGDCTLSRMLPHYFDKAKNLVMKPIEDKSGQSLHVDEYLGPENSEQRQQASHILGRVEKRTRNATAARSQDQWISLFGQ